MGVNLESFGIDQLSIKDRLELIELIWDSLPEEVIAADLPPWHIEELKKRRSEATASPGAGQPWREVLNQLGTKP
jgi:putative addiction module component (TIGR02574 family)